jgi:RNA recognition motif-containing protein
MTPSASSAPSTKNQPPIIAPSILHLHKTPSQHLQTLPPPLEITPPFLNPTDYPVTFPSNQTASPVLPSEPLKKTLTPTSFVNSPAGTDQLKLFFERFPSWVEYQDLKKTFGKFGRVVKLFLSKRKTVLGRRFGFVEILSPLPVSDLCDQASNVWFDSYKLRVNPAKLQFSKPPLPTSPHKPLPKPASHHKPQLMFRNNRSYAEVLTSKPQQMVTKIRHRQGR